MPLLLCHISIRHRVKPKIVRISLLHLKPAGGVASTRVLEACFIDGLFSDCLKLFISKLYTFQVQHLRIACENVKRRKVQFCASTLGRPIK